MKRRHFLKASAAASAVPALGPWLSGIARAQDGLDWKRHEGKTINVGMSRHPWQEAIEPLIPDFEALTGITVQLTKLPEQQYLTKIVADLTSGTFAQDVFMTQYYDAPSYQEKGWTADLQPFLDMAADESDYDYDDFFPAARDVSKVGGRYVDRIAITSEAQALVYRTDVLEELGLEVPTTFDELAAAAAAIGEKTKLAGITLRGGASNWWPLYGVVRSYGGEYVDGDLKPVIDSPESDAALTMYATLASHAPRGVSSYDWDEINTAMLSGQAAMFLDSSVIYARLQDPELSNVVGKIGIAPFVEGPAGRHGHSHFWTISLAETAKEPDAGWLFVQWATSKELQGKIALAGVLGARKSSWEVEGLSDVFPPEFIEAVSTSLDSAVISPANLKFFELMDPLRVKVQETITGGIEPAEALKSVQAEWERILA